MFYGTLLGDSGIEKKKYGCRILFCNRTGQEDYFNHKCNMFYDILGSINKNKRFDKRTNKYYDSFKVKTLTCKELNTLYKQLYINGKKTITEKWLNKLTPKSLAYWFMDDGNNKGILAINCFSYNECLLIQNILKK